ncbi:MAG TPA: thymidine phosphorylase [Thermoanaerobaculia bacterium]
MIPTPFRVLDRLREGRPPLPGEVRAAVAGAADGSWSDAQLGAFLMAVAIHGLDAEATRDLTVAMLESGERWDLAADFPALADKHSTGGVADTVSLVLGPLLAACDVPVVMLTGRGLGHTMGTTDKLEAIPGFSLDHDRPAAIRLLAEHGLAILSPTPALAPADRRLYALRDQTATIRSLPLITGSILSKKLATGAAGLVFDVKTGNGAFLADPAEARRLAAGLVDTCRALGRRATALLTDMSQPLGEWAGHTAEVRATFEALEGRGEPDLVAVTFALAREMAALVGRPLADADLERAIAGGRAREKLVRWAEAQGGDAAWLARPRFDLAPVEAVIEAPRAGVLARVDTRQLGLLLAEAGGGRLGPEPIDLGVALRTRTRLGRPVEPGDELARLHLRRDDPALVARVAACYEVADDGEAPVLIGGRVG